MIFIGCALLTVVASAAAAAGCEPGGPTAVLSAVVPVHGGADCGMVRLRGIQQLAALKSVVAEVNADLSAQDGLSIGLKWEDSCSTEAGAVSAALRLLVNSQQTCPQPPFHLGMVGPEEDEQLSRVVAVTAVFNVTHVLPRTTHVDSHHAVLAVAVDRLREQAQSVMTVVKRLGWRSIRLAFDSAQADLADAVIRLVNNDGTLCIKGTVTRLNGTMAIDTDGSDGLVVLAEGPEAAGIALASRQALSAPLLLLVREIGLEAFQLPHNVFLLQQISGTNSKVQEAMNTTLKTQLVAQRQSRCGNLDCQEDVLSELMDESVTALSDGVRLLAAALRATHNACKNRGQSSCGQTTVADWRAALRRVTATRRGDPTRLRFNMDLPPVYTLYTRDSAGPLVQIATVTSGLLKQTLASYEFPAAAVGDAGDCDGTAQAVAPAHAPPVPPAPPVDAPAPPTLKDLYSSEYAFYELVGMICGVGFIMFAVMVVIIYVIYNSLVEKGEKESTGGSVESRGGSVAARNRPARRNLRDTFRRGASIRSSTHS